MVHDALICAGDFEAAAEAHARRVHVHFHGVARVPPVIAIGHGNELAGALGGGVGAFAGAGEHAIDAFARDGGSGEFGDGFFELLAIRGDAVPTGLILHERNALALHGVGDDHRGIAAMRGGGVERAEDFVESWPSISITFQPNVAYFDVSGSTFMTSLDPAVDLQVDCDRRWRRDCRACSALRPSRLPRRCLPAVRRRP